MGGIEFNLVQKVSRHRLSEELGRDYSLAAPHCRVTFAPITATR
jgi:hypothetical protein